mgnify:CR=1 FL=1
MKRITIRRSDLGDLPAMLFYKQFAISGGIKSLKGRMGNTTVSIQYSWLKTLNTKTSEA